MKVTKSKLDKIKELITGKYVQLAVTVVGLKSLNPDEKSLASKLSKELGIDLTNEHSLLNLVYLHHYLNSSNSANSPKIIKDAIRQQIGENVTPNNEVLQKLNDDMKFYINKMAVDTMFRVEGIINNSQDPSSMFGILNQASKTSVTKLKQELKDTSTVANRDWERVALTELSNAVGLGSVNRIIDDHDGQIDDVYVYKLTVKDNITCQWCKKFYGSDTPKVYKLSTLLSNGSNYGKPRNSWLPVVGSTHPNTRTSAIMELKPGFIIGPDRNQTYVGIPKQKEWLKNNVKS